ncbi:MAG: hypothetical protein ACI93R_003002 [Flavobacteriales bacterium]
MPTWSKTALAYCANVHPGTRAADIEKNILSITSRLRRQLTLDMMHAGLWVCENALEEYKTPESIVRLQSLLKKESLKVVTLNGFPQVDFHQDIVKQTVYLPSWADVERLEYTKGLATLLAEILPEDENIGTISTVPLGYRIGWTPDQHALACQHLCEFTEYAENIERRTGKHIRLCLEMEPGCVLETTPQVIEFFSDTFAQHASESGFSQARIRRYIGLCYDVCHQAVMQEDIAESVRAITVAGIIIGKVQISSALKADISPATLVKLQEFAEPKYMHQTTRCDDNGQVIFADDLSDIISDSQWKKSPAWWIHYHLPIQIARLDDPDCEGYALSTTRDQIEAFLDQLANLSYAPHIEIETYTWNVLPQRQRANSDDLLINGLSAEYAWLHSAMQQRQLIRD